MSVVGQVSSISEVRCWGQRFVFSSAFLYLTKWNFKRRVRRGICAEKIQRELSPHFRIKAGKYINRKACLPALPSGRARGGASCRLALPKRLREGDAGRLKYILMQGSFTKLSL